MNHLEKRDRLDKHEHRSIKLQIKAVGDDGKIEGYGSVFGVLDSYADVVAKGAFDKSLAAHKADGTLPAMLWQHDSSEPIGVWTEMSEDERGLRVLGQIAIDTSKGKDAYALLKMNALNGLSIGFVTKAYDYDVDTDVRTVTEIDLWEVSLVTFPANGKSRIDSIKSSVEQINMPKDAELALRDAGFTKSLATAFVSKVMAMGQDRRDADNDLLQAIKSAERLQLLMKD